MLPDSCAQLYWHLEYPNHGPYSFIETFFENELWFFMFSSFFSSALSQSLKQCFKPSLYFHVSLNDPVGI